jgi:hypothetical protein
MIARLRTASTLLCLAACPIRAGLAREKSDVIVMKNGDHITGEIKTLQSGVLKVDLDYVDGTISIDWLKIARIQSNAIFVVQLQNGSVYSATIASRQALASVPGQLELQPVGQEAIEVSAAKVVALAQSSESLTNPISGKITMGTTYTKANETAQYTIGSEFDYLETRWGSRTTYNSNLTRSNGARTATRNQVDTIAYHLLPWKNYFYAGLGSFLQSSEQGIDREIGLGAGAGRFIKNNNHIRLSVLAGLGWQRDDYVPSTLAERSQNVGVALISTNLEVFSFKKTRFNITASFAPVLTEQSRIFSKVNASYYVKLFGQVDWNLSFYGNWDTRPPGRLAGNDYGSSTGLSWSFGNK